MEWESVIKATNSDASPDVNGLPYRTLESIHLYVAANALKRTIIVLADSMARNFHGQSLQENSIGGIYLPLDTNPQQCHKSPLVISYSYNHFSPLVFELDSTNDIVEMYAVPIVTKRINMLECKFLLPHEESGSVKLLQNYLNLKDVVYDGLTIPAAVVNHCPLPDTVNVVKAFRKNCEVKFRNMTGETVGIGQPPNISTGTSRPTVTLPPPVHKVSPKPAVGLTAYKKCLTVSCTNPGDPNLHELCAMCFNDFTIQYAKQEEARRRISQRAAPLQSGFQRIGTSNPAPVELLARPESSQYAPGPQPNMKYYDLSMMNEDCQAKCGFKCAVETYPYCHECYPKYVKKQDTTPVFISGSINQLSMMPDTCSTQGCSYKCSKATFPFCHQCFEQHRETLAQRPTAPPRSMEDQVITPRYQELQSPRNFSEPILSSRYETGVVSLRSRSLIKPEQPLQGATSALGKPLLTTEPNCKTIGCKSKAETELEGYCDHCYQLCLFEPNVPPSPRTPELSPVCPLPNCGNLIVSPEMQMCTNCFLSKHTGNGQTDKLFQRLNIAPSVESKKMNLANYEEDPVPVRYHSGELARSMPAEHDENQSPGDHITNLVVEAQEEKYKKYSAGVKHICAKPGCDGTRTEPSGLCRSCEVGDVPCEGETNEQMSNPVASVSPQLTEQEIRELNPVVLSSKDKLKCSYPSCNNMIYPPKKLCDVCITILDRESSERNKIKSQEQAMSGTHFYFV